MQRVDPGALPERPYVGLEHIGAGTLQLERAGSSAGVQSACLRFERGDLIFGRLRPNFRKLIRAPFDGLCTPEAWVLRPRAEVDPDYLFYLLADPDFVQRCVRSAEGTRMPRARWEAVAGHPVWLPDLEEQRRRATPLALMDRKIGLLREMSLTLQRLNLGLLQRAAREQRWAMGPLDELVQRVQQGVEPASLPPDTPCVGMADLPRERLGLERWGLASDARSDKHAFQEGDLLFGRLRPALRKAVLAPVSGVCSPELLVLRASTPAMWPVAAGWLGLEHLWLRCEAVATGTRMPRVSARSLLKLQVPLPSALQAVVLETQLRPLLQRLMANINELRTLRALRDALLPGQLDCGQPLDDA